MPPSPRPGSTLWFLGHDARLAWRDARDGFRSLGGRTLALVALAAALLMHAAAWPAAEAFAALDDGEAEALAAPAILFVLLLMLSQAVTGATRLLYERGDLDLLLASPFPARILLLVRALGVAAAAAASAALFVVPFANAGVLGGHPAFLALYPALLGGGLFAGAAGLAVTLGLFRLFGPRATRLAGQILATLIGAAFLIGAQVRSLLPAFSSVEAVRAVRAAAGGWGGLLLLPLDAALGRPPAAAVWLFGSAALLGAVALLCGPGFVRFARAAASRSARAGAGPRRRARFSNGVARNLRTKEWRLIARDPWVVSQILLQILYMTPIAAMLWSSLHSASIGLAPAIVVITFQLASSLAWLSLSGEDAPDLLDTAPVPPATLHRGKVEAVAALTLAIVGIPLAILAWLSPVAAATTLACCLPALVAAVSLQGWLGQPGRRSAFAARHRQSKLLGLIETILAMLWGLTAALAVLSSPWALAPLALIGLVLALCRPRRAAPPVRAGP